MRDEATALNQQNAKGKGPRSRRGASWGRSAGSVRATGAKGRWFGPARRSRRWGRRGTRPTRRSLASPHALRRARRFGGLTNRWISSGASVPRRAVDERGPARSSGLGSGTQLRGTADSACLTNPHDTLTDPGLRGRQPPEHEGNPRGRGRAVVGGGARARARGAGERAARAHQRRRARQRRPRIVARPRLRRFAFELVEPLERLELELAE